MIVLVDMCPFLWIFRASKSRACSRACSILRAVCLFREQSLLEELPLEFESILKVGVLLVDVAQSLHFDYF